MITSVPIFQSLFGFESISPTAKFFHSKFNSMRNVNSIELTTEKYRYFKLLVYVIINQIGTMKWQ